MRVEHTAGVLLLAAGGLVVLVALAAGVVAGRLLASRPFTARAGHGREAWVGGMAGTSSVGRSAAETLAGSKERLERAKEHSMELGGRGDPPDSSQGPGD